MARNFNVRRRAINYTENITDAGERLMEILAGRHFADRVVITERILNRLNDLTLPQIQSAIERTENTLTVADTLMDILKNLKKLKETQKVLDHKDQVAARKNEQKDQRKTELDARMNISQQWDPPNNADEDMNLIDL